MTNYELIVRTEIGTLHSNPFRRTDVHFTDASWTNPITGEREWDSIPVAFLVTFFKLDERCASEEEIAKFEREREEWLLGKWEEE